MTTQPPPTVTVVTVAPQGATSCAAAVRSGDPGALLSAFRAARLAGTGAAGCVTREALANYCQSSRPCTQEDLDRAPGAICLYECGGYRVVEIDIESVTKDGAGNLSAYLGVKLQNPAGEPRPTNEAITLGPGIPSGDDTTRAMVITDASTTA